MYSESYFWKQSLKTNFKPEYLHLFHCVFLKNVLKEIADIARFIFENISHHLGNQIPYKIWKRLWNTLYSLEFNSENSFILESNSISSTSSAFRYDYVSRDSSVGIATAYGLDCRGSIPDRSKRIFSFPQLPDQLWGPSEYRGVFLRRSSGRVVKLTTHLHLVPRSRMMELYINSPIRLHGIMLN
jgi:hypothetical protein